MALPCGTTGSLCSTFVPARHVRLTVKHPYANALYTRLPSVLRVPLKASDTLLEATTPVKLPTTHCPYYLKLESNQRKGGISRLTPRKLALPLQSLPPILHIIYPNSMQSYSEGARGLSVPLRVLGIFTETSISQGSWLRQWSDRYTIRAGLNLPDKEFRYLRTIIVIADIHQGL